MKAPSGRPADDFVCTVLLPGLPKPLTYAIPVELEPGQLLILPVRNTLRCGWLWHMEEKRPEFALKSVVAPCLPTSEIQEVVSQGARAEQFRWQRASKNPYRIPAALWQTLTWAAPYYGQVPSRFVSQFLPDELLPDLRDGYLILDRSACHKEIAQKALVRQGHLWVEARKLTTAQRQDSALLRWPLPSLRMDDEDRYRATARLHKSKTSRNEEAIRLLSRSGGASIQDLSPCYKDPRSAIRRAVRSGNVTPVAVLASDKALPFADSPKLTDPQAHVLQKIRQSKGYSPILLHGVTGSGKTEIFVQLAQSLLPQGKQILLLAPEIGIATQLAQRITDRLPGHVYLFHSALGAAQRQQTLDRARSGKAMITVGARSALSVPMHNLAAIIVDEEHEAAYKSPDNPYVNGRDLALVLGRKADVPVLLASATPSLQTWFHCHNNTYSKLSLPRSISGSQSRYACFRAGRQDPLPHDLKEHIAAALARDEQVAILKNRRGRYRQIRCRKCGHYVECPDCDLPLVQHQHPQPHLLCHACGQKKPQPDVCPACQQKALVHSRPGTQRWEEYLAKTFADCEIIRIDSDSTTGVTSWLQLYQKVSEGRRQILIGTQMLAKGFDFPNLHTMVITGVDNMLSFPKVRAWEQTASLLVQAGGRTGRRQTPGTVWLESWQEDHPVIQAVMRGDYAAFLDTELARREQTGFPPCKRALRLSVETDIEPDSAWLRRKLTQLAKDHPDLLVLGPTEEDVSKRRRKWRSEALALSSSSAQLHHFAHGVRAMFDNRIFFDFDPVEY